MRYDFGSSSGHVQRTKSSSNTLLLFSVPSPTIAMPSEHKSPLAVQHQQDQPQGQAKECSTCHVILHESATSLFLPESGTVVCLACRERTLTLISTQDVRPHRIDQDTSYPVRQPTHELPIPQSTRRYQDILPADFDSDVSSSPASSVLESSTSYSDSSPASSSYSNKSLNIHCDSIPQPTFSRHHTSFASHSYESTRPQSTSYSSPDPLSDITRLRIRSRGHHCLHPGSAFQGTQKSGRNSYDVNVTIVDVNFASSTLCGYLRIRGLTDDWPELTTYFDAEIIGNRYGFLTQNWGATQHEDLVHWSRFPAFKHIRHEAKRPHMTIDGQDRGAVFMRWKERFLVPDHRVQDINGASFAGFYYVCVDFNPQASISSTTTSVSQSAPSEEGIQSSQTMNSTKGEGRQRTRRDSSVRRREASPTPLSAPVATMSGFYYHQNSEPYQQLSLTHIPERTSSSFEFR